MQRKAKEGVGLRDLIRVMACEQGSRAKVMANFCSSYSIILLERGGNVLVSETCSQLHPTCVNNTLFPLGAGRATQFGAYP